MATLISTCQEGTLSDLINLQARPFSIDAPLPNEEWNLLAFFTAENDVANVEKLILCGANTEVTQVGGAGQTCLHIAARYGSVECLDLLVNGVKRERKVFAGAGFDQTMNKTVTETTTADDVVEEGEGTVGLRGGGLDQLDKSGFSPLHYAANAGYVEACDKLLRMGANPLIKGEHE